MTGTVGHFDLNSEHRRVLFNALAYNQDNGAFHRDFYVLKKGDLNRLTVKELCDKKIFKEVDLGDLKFYRVTKYGKSVARRLIDLGYKRHHRVDHSAPQRINLSIGEQ